MLRWDGKKGGKTEILIRITSLCNLRCSFCFADYNFGNIGADEVLKSVISKLHQEGIEGDSDIFVNITGGEPLVRKDFFEILRNLKRIFKRHTVNLQTNAVLITEELAENMYKNNIRSAFVGLPAITERTYNKLTGRKGLFGYALRGINYLIKSGIDVCLNIILTKLSIKEFRRIPDFVSERFGRDVSVNLSTLSPGTPAQFLEKFGVDYMEAGKIFQDVYSGLGRAGIRYGSFGGDCSPPACAFSDKKIYRIFSFDKSPLPVKYQEDLGLAEEGLRYKSLLCKKCRFDNYCPGVSAVYARVYKSRNFNPR
ncbi:MAG: radical SAM protein [Deltaproteobacteria bacterium]|nr:radical SAM protein [Deltaproteobacteria bacterium]